MCIYFLLRWDLTILQKINNQLVKKKLINRYITYMKKIR